MVKMNMPMFNLVDRMTTAQRHFESLLRWLVLTIMFAEVNLATNVKLDLEPLFDS